MKNIKIKNSNNELLDVFVEGNNKSKVTIIFVHGFAVDKHETAQYFDDLSSSLGLDYRIVRFDFSGCGKSEGRLEDKNYNEWSKDLSVIIKYVKKEYDKDIYILSQSMGCFITSIISPKGIKKTVFTGIPNNNTQFIINRISERFSSRSGAKINHGGISIFPRSSGKIQKIGQTFWQVLKEFNPLDKVKEFSKKTKLLIIHPKQDDIVGTEYLNDYSTVPGITIKWLDGDHSFTKLKDRKKLIEEVRSFFKSF